MEFVHPRSRFLGVVGTKNARASVAVAMDEDEAAQLFGTHDAYTLCEE